jgi:hypothetical protein
MPYDPSGNFSRLHNWQADRDAGIRILADRHDEEDDNFASAFNIAFLRTGTVPMTGDLTMSGNAIRTVGAGSAANPSLTFELSPRTGLYQVNPTTIGVSSNGVDIFDVNGTGINVNGTGTFTGDVTAPNINAGGAVIGGGNLTLTGNISAVGGSFSGDVGVQDIYARDGIFSRNVSVTGNITSSATILSPNFNIDAGFYLGLLSGTDPLINWDANDYITYSRSGDSWGFVINGTSAFAISAAAAVVSGTFQAAGQINARIAGNGYVALMPGGVANTGYVAFWDVGGTRKGYIGFIPTAAGAQSLSYQNETGGAHQFAQAVNVTGTIYSSDKIFPGADANFYIGMGIGAGPGIGWNANCWMDYNRSTGELRQIVNGVGIFNVAPNDSYLTGNWHVSNAGYFGPNSSLRCLHDGTNGFVQAMTGNLYLGGGGSNLMALDTAMCTVTGQYNSNGSSAAYGFADRAGGSNSSNILYSNGNNVRFWRSDVGDNLLWDQGTWRSARGDLQLNLGGSGFRFGSVWCANSAMNTSDAREKKWRGGLNEYEVAAAKELVKEIGIYQWLRDLDKDGDQAKMQCGITAQKAIAIFHSHGLDALAYGFVSFDEWDETTYNDENMEPVIVPGGNRYSIMFPDILAFMMVGQEQRLDALEAKVEYLSGYGKRSDP